MSLRPLLPQITDHDGRPPRSTSAAAGRSSRMSLRPALVAALADHDPAIPTVVVAGDDRQARDLAADAARLAAPRAGALLPEPRRRLRVAPHAAAAPDRACGSRRSTR